MATNKSTTSYDHQDWKPVILRKEEKKIPRAKISHLLLNSGEIKGTSPNGEVKDVKNAANSTSGGEFKVDTVRRYGTANSASKKSITASRANKLDAETETFRHPELSHTFTIALQQARNRKSKSQEELAGEIGVKTRVIQDYERGTAIPNSLIINKLNTALGVILPKIPAKKRVE